MSNLVKLSLLFCRAYKYELIIFNKQIHFSAFHSFHYSQFNNLNSELKFNKPSKQSKTIPESSVPWIIIKMTLKCLCHRLYGQVARKSSRPKSCRSKPESCRPIFWVLTGYLSQLCSKLLFTLSILPIMCPYAVICCLKSGIISIHLWITKL